MDGPLHRWHAAYLKGGKTMVPLSRTTLRPPRLRVMTASSWNHSTAGAGSPPAAHSSRRPLLLEKTAELGGCVIQTGGISGAAVDVESLPPGIVVKEVHERRTH